MDNRAFTRGPGGLGGGTLKKHSLIKVAGLFMAAALAFTGCDSGGSDPGVVLGGGGGTSVTGGGTTTTTTTTSTGGTTGFGITGGSLTGAFGGTGGSSGTGSGTGTGTGTGTATGTGSGTAGNGFLGSVQPLDLETGLNNPTDFSAIVVNGTARFVVLDGFRQGASQGRLLISNGTDFVQVGANQGTDPNVGPDLDSPFAMVALGNTLFLSIGFGQTNDGKIVRVDNFTQTATGVNATFTDITANFTPPVNPAYMTIVSGVNADGNGPKDFIYFTQYSSNTGGANVVRRVSTDGTLSQVVVNNLNFPAGIDHDGGRMVVCDAAGGAGSNGQVIKFQLTNVVTTPLNGSSGTDVTIVQPAAGEAPILRPLDVVYDGNNGFFFTEGGAIQAQTGPGPLGPGQGRVRFLPSTPLTAPATLVNDGLDAPAGIDAIDTNDDGTAAVLFSEARISTGRVLRRLVNTNNIDNTVSPTVTDTGINNPLFVGIADEDDPLVFAVINYIGGQANGIFRSYSGN